MDSHADTCCAGANCVRIGDTNHVVRVYPFHQDCEPIQNVPVTSVVTAWDDPNTGDTTLLIIHQALYFGDKMTNTLLCPNQLRDFGVRVDDLPRQFQESSLHSIMMTWVLSAR